MNGSSSNLLGDGGSGPVRELMRDGQWVAEVPEDQKQALTSPKELPERTPLDCVRLMKNRTERRQAIQEALEQPGASFRSVMAETGAAKQTVQSVADSMERPPCPCGKPAGHKEWCSRRYENSPARQATVQNLGRKERTRAKWGWLFEEIAKGNLPLIVTPPEGLHPATWANQMRCMLAQNKDTCKFRWSIVKLSDGKFAVKKVGVFESYETREHAVAQYVVTQPAEVPNAPPVPAEQAPAEIPTATDLKASYEAVLGDLLKKRAELTVQISTLQVLAADLERVISVLSQTDVF